MLKTNKHDFEQQMKAIDIMHRMLDHQSMLLIEIIQHQLNDQNDPVAVIENKRKYLLQQAQNIHGWI